MGFSASRADTIVLAGGDQAQITEFGTGSTAVISVDVTALPADTDLEIQYVLRTDSTEGYAEVTFNGDATANYNTNYSRLNAVPALVGSADDGDNKNFIRGTNLCFTSSPAGLFTEGLARVLDYKTVGRAKQIRGANYNGVNTADADIRQEFWGGTLKTLTTAVTSITFTTTVGNFTADSFVRIIARPRGSTVLALQAAEGRAQLHDPTEAFGGATLLCWQGDGTNGDATGNHTFGVTGAPSYQGAHIPGTKGFYAPLNGDFYSTTAGTAHQRGLGEAVSAYGVVSHDPNNPNATPYFFMSGINGAGSTINYALVLVGNVIQYQDSGSGVLTTSTPMPSYVPIHLGFTRDASDVVNVYLNGANILLNAASTPPAAAGDFFVGAAGVAANGYWLGGMMQSLKVVNVALSAGEMLQEAQRTLGR